MSGVYMYVFIFQMNNPFTALARALFLCLPCRNHPINTVLHSTAMLYVVVITTYNVSAIFITQLLESVWRSILENFRPIAVNA